MEDGAVTDMDDMEKIWQHSYKALKIESEHQPMLLVDRSLFAPKDTREKMAQIAFETFLAPAFYAAHADVLSVCCSSGSSQATGLSIYSCDGYTSVAPVFEGLVIRHAATRAGVGGKLVTDFLEKRLAERGLNLERGVIQDIKEKMCHLALDADQEFAINRSVPEEPYTLPDGRIIKIGDERARAPEGMFVSELFGLQGTELHVAVSNTISKCDHSTQSAMAENVVFSGGNTRFPGFRLRLQQELRSRLPKDWYVSVKPPDTNHSAWLGGSWLGSLSSFRKMAITYDEYDETGPTMVHRKCF